MNVADIYVRFLVALFTYTQIDTCKFKTRYIRKICKLWAYEKLYLHNGSR